MKMLESWENPMLGNPVMEGKETTCPELELGEPGGWVPFPSQQLPEE